MALEPCPDCGHTISTLALACPACGAPGEATRTPVVVPGALVPAPVAEARAESVGPRRPWLDTTRVLLLVGALGAALLGAVADAAVHRLLSRDTQGPGGALVGAAGTAVSEDAGATAQPPAADSLNPYQARAIQLEEETALRIALDDLAAQQESWLAANHAYASSLDALQYLAPPGVHVRLSAGPGWWSATAEHEALPGFTCTRGKGAAFSSGKITCTPPDTAGARAR